MNKCLIISEIENLELESGTSFNYFEWTITNNTDEVRNLISNLPLFTSVVGAMTMHLFENKTLAYIILQLKDGETYLNRLYDLSVHLSALLSLFWLFNDNAVYNSRIFSQAYAKGSIGTSYLDIINSNAYGKYDKLVIDRNFIEKYTNNQLVNYSKILHARAESYISPLEVSVPNKYNVVAGTTGGRELEVYYPSFTRIQRAFFLLQVARRTNFLPMKIGFYINVLECLLINQSSELNFRLQLHTASFIGENKVEKEEIRGIISSVYDVRSKFFHGVGSKYKLDSLQKLSQQTDDIVRRVFIKAIDNHEEINDNNKFGDYLKSFVFS